MLGSRRVRPPSSASHHTSMQGRSSCAEACIARAGDRKRSTTRCQSAASASTADVCESAPAAVPLVAAVANADADSPAARVDEDSTGGAQVVSTIVGTGPPAAPSVLQQMPAPPAGGAGEMWGATISSNASIRSERCLSRFGVALAELELLHRPAWVTTFSTWKRTPWVPRELWLGSSPSDSVKTKNSLELHTSQVNCTDL